MRSIRAVSWVGLLVILIAVGVWEYDASAITLGKSTLVLQSQRYYKKWDLTRLVYRVKSNKNEIPTYFVLEAGDCLEDGALDPWLSTPYEWVEEPFDGIRFEIYSKSQRIYLWLNGQWDVESVDTALVFLGNGGGDDETLTGKIEGPSCGGSSISLEVVNGASVQFPQLLDSGRWEAETQTQLVISSSQSGWDFGYQLGFSIPEGARQDIVSKIVEVNLSPYATTAGDTSIVVSYALNVEDDDFVGLPEGTYTISITYTITGGS